LQNEILEGERAEENIRRDTAEVPQKELPLEKRSYEITRTAFSASLIKQVS
jgi:hypothetical protein